MIRCKTCQKKRTGKLIIAGKPVCYTCAQEFIEHTLETVKKARQLADYTSVEIPSEYDQWGAKEFIQKLDEQLRSIEEFLGV